MFPDISFMYCLYHHVLHSQYSFLVTDDHCSQVLHYKLHSCPWRNTCPTFAVFHVDSEVSLHSAASPMLFARDTWRDNSSSRHESEWNINKVVQSRYPTFTNVTWLLQKNFRITTMLSCNVGWEKYSDPQKYSCTSCTIPAVDIFYEYITRVIWNIFRSH